MGSKGLNRSASFAPNFHSDNRNKLSNSTSEKSLRIKSPYKRSTLSMNKKKSKKKNVLKKKQVVN